MDQGLVGTRCTVAITAEVGRQAVAFSTPDPTSAFVASDRRNPSGWLLASSALICTSSEDRSSMTANSGPLAGKAVPDITRYRAAEGSSALRSAGAPPRRADDPGTFQVLVLVVDRGVFGEPQRGERVASVDIPVSRLGPRRPRRQ